MESTAFTCSVDRQNRIVTILVIGLLVIVPIVLLASSEGRSGTIASTIVFVTIAVIPIIIYGNLPRRMVVTQDAILLKCPFRTKVIPRDAKTEVQRVRDYDTQSLLCNWGSDWVFGKWRLFASRLHPRIYAKRSKQDWILVSSAGRVYVLAPDDGEAFGGLFD